MVEQGGLALSVGSGHGAERESSRLGVVLSRLDEDVRSRSPLPGPVYGLLFVVGLLAIFGVAWLACLPQEAPGQQQLLRRFGHPAQRLKSGTGAPARPAPLLQFLPPSHVSERRTFFAWCPWPSDNAPGGYKPSPLPNGPSGSAASPGMRDPQFSYGGGPLPSAANEGAWPQVITTRTRGEAAQGLGGPGAGGGGGGPAWPPEFRGACGVVGHMGGPGAGAGPGR